MNTVQSSNPFVGLRPFESDESLLFFGRQEQTLELLQRLHEHHFVAVVGSSGSGKSSLIRAGLIPALKAGYLVDERDRWMVAIMKPGENPLYNLAESILSQTGGKDEPSGLINRTREEGADAIVEILRPLWEKERTNIFLLVDQFEELFRFSGEQMNADKLDDATDFVNILLELSGRLELPIYAVITMRSDFIGDCSRFFGLPEAMNKSQYLVPRLNRVQLKNAIESPVKLYGARINPALTARLLNNLHLTKDELPVLQHALMRTWEVWIKRNKPNAPIDLADYDQTGTMEHALSQHAEEAYNELNERQKHICEIMFKALTDKGSDVRGVRRPQRLTEIAMASNASHEETTEVINVFRRSGRTFLMPPENIKLTAESIIDISHESLMRIWDRLVQWASEEHQSERIYLRLSQAAELYENGTGSLWRNPELQIALNWKKQNSPNEVWAKRSNNLFSNAMLFLEKSRQQAELELYEKERLQKQRLHRARTFAALLSVIAIGAVLLAFYAFRQKENALNQEQYAVIQKGKADSSTREALRQKTIAEQEKLNAEKSAKDAQEQQTLAEREKSNAEKSEKEAQEQQNIAEQEKLNAQASATEAQKQQHIAEEEKSNAEKNAKEAQKQQGIAEEQTKNAGRLTELALSRNYANEAILLQNENRFDSSKEKALAAYRLNDSNGGPQQNNDIYNALYLNWTKEINNHNQFTAYKMPVRCIAGLPGSDNIFFTSDESGILYELSFENNNFQPKDTFLVKEEVRAMATSSDGKKLVAITAYGKGRIFNISRAGISPGPSFIFPGTGKAVLFNSDESFIILSSKGIGKYQSNNLADSVFLFNNNIHCFSIGKSGKLYVAQGRQVQIYKGWNEMFQHTAALPFPSFESNVTSIALNDKEEFIAVGTYNGYVWIHNFNDENNSWYRAVHLSSVNDLKFAPSVNNSIQLAAAGSDQTIKLINVKAIIEKNNNEDILTLRGHSKWVYALYYTPDGRWLFSSGEDNKIFAWRPAMFYLYQSLIK